MIAALRILRSDTAIGVGSLAVAAAVGLFHLLVLMPLEERSSRLDRQLDFNARGIAVAMAPDDRSTASAQLAAFYRFFDRATPPDEWLATLYGIATAAGLEMNAAEYRLLDTRQRLTRYQITLPVAGSYRQIRGFLQTALADIPVLSLDRASFRRKEANNARVEAEIVLTLYLLSK